MNIPYELALKLRNAGFSQKGKGEYHVVSGTTVASGTDVVIYYEPALFELIEEVRKFVDNRSIGAYWGSFDLKYNPAKGGWDAKCVFPYPTEQPELKEKVFEEFAYVIKEAVANLYLALTK